MIVKLNCLGGAVFVNTEQIPKDTFLSKLIEWEPESKEFSVSEPKNVVSNLLASVKYNTLIDDNVSLKEMFLLAKSWCFPEEILNVLESEIFVKIEKEQPLVCKICGVGFKQSENTATSCKLHTEKFSLISRVFVCCGKKTLEEYCKIGYHVAESEADAEAEDLA
jgi:hypothetical protein